MLQCIFCNVQVQQYVLIMNFSSYGEEESKNYTHTPPPSYYEVMRASELNHQTLVNQNTGILGFRSILLC